MFDWFQKKNYPDFWKTYSDLFKHKNNVDLDKIRFVVFDTETTGLHITKDRILSIGAISVIGKSIDVSDSFEIYVKQEEFNKDSVQIHGILKEGNLSKLSEKDAVIQFLEYIKDAVLVAHHTAFDVAMINECLKRLDLPKLKNKTLDTGILFKKAKQHEPKEKPYSLDELCTIFHVNKHDRHTASGDAFITALLFLKMISGLKKSNKKLTLKDLFFVKPKHGLI
jgi:DNA polymerase-3 subunit epsilon